MSPSENDLRRSLRRGEDDGGIDVSRIIIAGERRRAQRRSRIGTGATVLALASLVVGGGVLLARTGDTESGGSSSGGQAADKQPAPAQGRAAAAQASSPAARSSAGPACPAGFPRLALPGGGGTGQFGAGGKLFAAPVATIIVCRYATADALAGRTTVPPALTRTLAASLEAASTGYPACPSSPTKSPRIRRYALLPVSTDGRRLRTVTVELDPVSCPNQVTNGTAVRTLWQPPAGLAQYFSAADTMPRATGSPIRS